MIVASANKSIHRRRFHTSSKKRFDLELALAASFLIEKKSSQLAPFVLGDFITVINPTTYPSHSDSNSMIFEMDCIWSRQKLFI
jgi:hypothetical protein